MPPNVSEGQFTNKINAVQIISSVRHEESTEIDISDTLSSCKTRVP